MTMGDWFPNDQEPPVMKPSPSMEWTKINRVNSKHTHNQTIERTEPLTLALWPSMKRKVEIKDYENDTDLCFCLDRTGYSGNS